MLQKSVKENNFKLYGTNRLGGERYESVLEFVNKKGKIKGFHIYADRDEEDNLRIVTAFIR